MAHPTASREAVSDRMAAAWLAFSVALVAAVGSPSRAEDRRELVAPYLAALASRTVGEIEARAYVEPKRPDGAPLPSPGVSVRAVPYAAGLEARLDAIKRHQRDSMATYTQAHADVTSAREAYERELSASGAGELILSSTSNADGVLRLSGVPVGEWLVLGWREDAHAVKAARPSPKDAGRFAEKPTSIGFAAVSYWKMRVVVRPGEATSVNLTDRGVWLTAVREEFAGSGQGAPSPATPKRR